MREKRGYRIMSKDQALGSMILLGSILGIAAYFYLTFLSSWIILTIQISAFIAVAAILLIIAWIGYTLATTPPPTPLEDLDLEEGTETLSNEEI